jgi:hypothetical protein
MNDQPNWKRRAWIALACFAALTVSYCLESEAWRRQLAAAGQREQQLQLELDVLRRKEVSSQWRVGSGQEEPAKTAKQNAADQRPTLLPPPLYVPPELRDEP